MVVNRVSNGGFQGDLDNWDLSGSAAFIASQGNDELGAARLPGAGAAISQDFALPVSRKWMIEIWVKGTGSGNVDLAIVDDGANTVYSSSLSVTTSWAQALAARVGLPQGNYTLSLTYDDVETYIDDVSIAWVVKTRAELAAAAAGLLGELATSDAEYSTAPVGENTEGDYTAAVDQALRVVGAVNRAGDPDVRYLTEGTVDDCIDGIQRYMLHKLHRYYARNATDFTLEGRTEHWNQRVKAIENLLGIAVGGRPQSTGRGVQTRRLLHRKRL